MKVATYFNRTGLQPPFRLKSILRTMKRLRAYAHHIPPDEFAQILQPHLPRDHVQYVAQFLDDTHDYLKCEEKSEPGAPCADCGRPLQFKDQRYCSNRCRQVRTESALWLAPQALTAIRLEMTTKPRGVTRHL